MKCRHDDDSSNQLGDMIRKKRKGLQLTLYTVADYCKVSTNFISLIERGKKYPSDEVAISISEILELDEFTIFQHLNRVHPTIKGNINEAVLRHDGLRDLFQELDKKVNNDQVRSILYEEMYAVYVDFLNRHNLN